jgi:hypothetical protein
MTITTLAKVAWALIAFGVAGSTVARADILDAEDWSNHIEEIQQLQNTQQFRRTMNRGFDMMVGMGGNAGRPSATQQMANWNATLVVPAAAPGSELQRFLAHVDPSGRDEVAMYLRREFAAYPAAAAKAALNPRNVADARLFALETAFRAVHPNDSMPFEATFLLDIGLSQQMTGVYTVRQLTTRAKQDTLDYYIIVRSIFLPAVTGTLEYQLGDRQSRAKIGSLARTFVMHDAGIDPSTTSWRQLPCIGISQVDCDAHFAMARASMAGAR